MSQNDEHGSGSMITERDLLIGSFIVALGLVSFWIAYLGGRDIGSMLF